MRYFQNVDLFHDINNIVEYFEKDATSWLRKNYISELKTWDPDLPLFVLNNQYIIKLSENNQMNFTFTAFEDHWDSLFLFRIWFEFSSDNMNWTVPPWVLLNETTGSFIINTSKITSVQVTRLVFQSQLIGFSFLNNDLNNTISTFYSTFNFTNNNWAVAGSYSNWYVVIQQVANFTMMFDDAEGDTVFLKLIDRGNISLFIKQLNKSTYALIASWYDDTVSESTIVLAYTDVYHKESQYWTNISININVFTSKPPNFIEQPNNLVINLWQHEVLKFELPAISDPDSNIFKVSLANNPPDWIQIEAINSRSSNVTFNVSFILCGL